MVELDVGDDGCQSHQTAVAAGALAVYLYFSIAAPSSLRKEPSLTLPPPRPMRWRQRQEPLPGRFVPAASRRTLAAAEAEADKADVVGETDSESLPPAYYVFIIVVMLILYKTRFVIFRKMRYLFI